MALPLTQLEALVDVSKTDAGWLVVTTVTDRSGRELHKLISDSIVDDEQAHYSIGGQRSALERLGVPTGLSTAANELREWWETDRFTLIYYRHHVKEANSYPTLKGAFRAAEGMSEYGEGAPDEIQEADTERTLYRDEAGGWERVAADAPAVEEFEGVET